MYTFILSKWCSSLNDSFSFGVFVLGIILGGGYIRDLYCLKRLVKFSGMRMKSMYRAATKGAAARGLHGPRPGPGRAGN